MESTWWEKMRDMAELGEDADGYEQRKIGDEVARLAQDRAKYLREHQEWLYHLMVKNLEVYTGRAWSGRDWSCLRTEFAKAQEEIEAISTEDEPAHRQNFNVTQAWVDAGRAQLLTQKPRAAVKTYKADRKLRRAAKKLQRGLDGLAEAFGFVRKYSTQVLDATIYGLGAHKFMVEEEDGELLIDRVFRAELLIDEQISHPADLRELGHEKHYPVEVVRHRWGFDEDTDDPHERHINEAINHAAGDRPSGHGELLTDQVLVTEFWHLPSGSSADDGFRIVVCDGALLAWERWTRPTFPFAFYFWTTPERGFTPRGLVETLLGPQQEVDVYADKMQLNARLMAHNTWVIHKDAKLNEEDLSLSDGVPLMWEGAPHMKPTREMAMAIHPQLYQHMQWMMKELPPLITGVGADAALGQRLTSHMTGAAQRSRFDLQTVRLGAQADALGDLAVAFADQVIYALDDANEKGIDLKIKGEDVDCIEDISWKDLRMERDQFKLSLQPANALGNTIEERRQSAQELVQAGAMPPELLVEVLADAPDMEHLKPPTVRMSQAIDALLDRLEEWADSEDQELTPMPQARDHHDIDLAMLKAEQRVLDLEGEGDFDSDAHEALVKFLDECQARKEAAEEEAAAKMAQQQAAMQQGPGTAGPGPQ